MFTSLLRAAIVMLIKEVKSPTNAWRKNWSQTEFSPPAVRVEAVEAVGTEPSELVKAVVAELVREEAVLLEAALLEGALLPLLLDVEI